MNLVLRLCVVIGANGVPIAPGMCQRRKLAPATIDLPFD